MRFIVIVSLCLLILGIVLSVYGFISLISAEKTPEIDSYVTEFRFSGRDAAAYVCLALGCIIVFIGILGLFAIVCNNPQIACPFGLCSVCFAMFSFAFAIVIFNGNITYSLYDQVCNQPVAEFGGLSSTEYMRNQYGALVDDIMCSSNCNCD